MKPALLRPTIGSAHRNGHPRRPVPATPASSAQTADWRMPSGVGLAEYAWRGGVVAPGLMKRGAARLEERA